MKASWMASTTAHAAAKIRWGRVAAKRRVLIAAAANLANRRERAVRDPLDMDDGARTQPEPAENRAECFDGSLASASSSLLVLDIDEVVDLLHVSHAPERIAEYEAAMLAGTRFPPVSVVRLLGRFYLADGHKRFSAYRALGGERIPVELWTVRRWLGDQARQLGAKTRSQLSILLRSPFDAGARSRARRLFWDSLGHWRRIAVSLATLRRRGREGRPSA
jgi:hypothetical protein